MEEIDEDRIEGVFEAKFGYQGAGEDGCILVCQEWELPRTEDAQQYFCDECSTAIAVDPSSQWFMNNHREERDLEDA